MDDADNADSADEADSAMQETMPFACPYHIVR